MAGSGSCDQRPGGRPGSKAATFAKDAIPFVIALKVRSPVSAAPRSPQSRDLRVGPQLPLDIVTAGPEDNAGGAPGLVLGQTFAQLLARARERHLFGVGHVDQRIMPIRNVK